MRCSCRRTKTISAQFLRGAAGRTFRSPIGVGSNLIVRDGGVAGVVIRLAGRQFAQIETDSTARA